jgi:hypothetical protein
MAIHRQRHLYVDLPPPSMLLASSQSPQVATQLTNPFERSRILRSEASIQALGRQPRHPAVNGGQGIRAGLDIQRVEESHDQVRGVTADIQADEVTGRCHVTSVAK